MAGKKTTKTNAKPKAKRYVNIDEAAKYCGVTGQAVRKHIIADHGFPVESKGSGGKWGGYKIDIEKLDEWRKNNNLLNWTGPRFAGQQNPPADQTDPLTTRPLAMKDRKNQIQTDLLQLELDKAQGLLIDRAEVTKTFSTILARVAKLLDLFPAAFGRKMNFDAGTVEEIRKFHDSMRNLIAQGGDGLWSIESVEDLLNALPA